MVPRVLRDVPTLETLRGRDLSASVFPISRPRRQRRGSDALQPESEHPHGLSDQEFDSLFTTNRPVVFAYHGYPWLIHRLTYRRKNHDNLHVRGYKEEGTTTTPFDIVMLNDSIAFISRSTSSIGFPSSAGRQITCDKSSWTAACVRAHTGVSTGRIRPRSVTGPGPADARVGLILVVNAGSKSLKLYVVDNDERSIPLDSFDAAPPELTSGRASRGARWPALSRPGRD